METRSPLEPATRGVIFDLWNTLVFTDRAPNPVRRLAGAFGLDTGPGWRRAIERAIMTRRIPGIGEAIDAIASATGREISGGLSRRDLVLMWGEASNATRPYPDALPALRRLRRRQGGHACFRLGILSNTQSFDLDFLERDGLAALVDEICLSCDWGLLKPDPRFYRLAARRMGLAPEQILMVGDNLTDDVEGARSAGLRAALLDRGGIAAGALTSLTDLAARLTR